MPRPCGPCGDKRRNELDRSLLEMDITGETFRVISREFAYHVDALRRHKEHHLIVDLGDVKAAMEAARDEALEKVKAKEMQEIKTEVSEGMADRLENAASFLDQLREVRSKAASLLDHAEASKDLRSAASFLKELREQIRLMAEIEGKLAAQPQINFVMSSEWVELRNKILVALDPFPEAKAAIVHAIREQ